MDKRQKTEPCGKDHKRNEPVSRLVKVHQLRQLSLILLPEGHVKMVHDGIPHPHFRQREHG